MYITTKITKHYTVTSTALGIVEVRYTLEEAPVELGVSVNLYADDGVCIRTDIVADWKYPRIEGNTIILSNTAPAEPETPEPVEPVEPLLSDIQAWKLAEVNAACDAAITAGCGVTLSDGTAGHISLSIPDQINLSTAQEAIKAGGTGYAYHLDGALCEIYTAADIAIMAKAATAHVLYHQTYCNHVRVWVKRCETVVDVEAITYGAELPDDLKKHMETIIAAAGGKNA
ncbi:hypothetical protein OBV_01640 [Oscillibacter valericigenes Sjm18-20]|nr:hypothetical protein OBV_01640 [Oscillibacter valericigenes Sjm18-20]